MKYKITQNDKIFDTVDEVIEYCFEENDDFDEEYFEEWVNEAYATVDINGTRYYPYEILLNMDDGNLDDLRDRYKEDEIEDAKYELNHSKVGDITWCRGFSVEAIEERGDYDGDEAIENVKRFIEEQKILKESAAAEEKKQEEEIYKVFQVIK